MPLGHLSINVPDLAVARAYYDDLMPLLDYERHINGIDEVSYRPADGKRGTFLFLYPAAEAGSYSPERAGLGHLAFMVRTRTAVRAVHEHVVASGGSVVHAPREFPEYPPPYFATFWLDPVGILLEAVCHHDRD